MLMTLYNTFMKRNSVYMGMVLGGALVGQTVRGHALRWHAVEGGGGG